MRMYIRTSATAWCLYMSDCMLFIFWWNTQCEILRDSKFTELQALLAESSRTKQDMSRDDRPSSGTHHKCKRPN